MAAPEAPATGDEAPEEVEVVYALPGVQRVAAVPFRHGMTAHDAVESAGLLQEFPELGRKAPTLGVFGRVVPPAHSLRPGDRVEIYRPLRVDPREARRRLAAQGRTMGSRPPDASRS
jgi:hypothetical protein